MNAFGTQLLRQFSNRSLDGAVERAGSDAESLGYIGVANGVIFEPVVNS